MAEKRKFNAKINAKGTDNTGYTEDHARGACSSLGAHTLAIIDLRAHELVTDEDGNQTVKLAIDQLEPVPAAMEDDVRELMKALYRQRPEVMGQETLKGTAGDGPAPGDALGQAMSHIERDGDGDPTGTWDGDPDAPAPGLSAVPNQMCDYPGCLLPAHEDGDHQDTEAPEAAEDPVSAPQG